MRRRYQLLRCCLLFCFEVMRAWWKCDLINRCQSTRACFWSITAYFCRKKLNDELTCGSFWRLQGFWGNEFIREAFAGIYLFIFWCWINVPVSFHWRRPSQDIGSSVSLSDLIFSASEALKIVPVKSFSADSEICSSSYERQFFEQAFFRTYLSKVTTPIVCYIS